MSILPVSDDDDGVGVLVGKSVEQSGKDIERYREGKNVMRLERERFFNEKAKDALARVVELHESVIGEGSKVIERYKNHEALSETDLFILKQSLQSARELTDRAIGRSKQVAEVTQKTTLMAMILNKNDE